MHSNKFQRELDLKAVELNIKELHASASSDSFEKECERAAGSSGGIGEKADACISTASHAATNRPTVEPRHWGCRPGGQSGIRANHRAAVVATPSTATLTLAASEMRAVCVLNAHGE